MLYLIFPFILGTVVGSFINVCIHRLPRGESIVYPASRCPRCGQRLGPLDLIPVLGYFLVGGKCRYCRSPISPRYPLVEFLTGMFFVAAALAFSPVEAALEFAFSLVFLSLMMIVFFIDLEHQLIPDAVSVSGIFFGLGFNFLKGFFFSAGDLNPFLSAVYGALLGYVIFFLIRWLGRMAFKKEAVGEGDLYLAALLGACLGWKGALLSIFLAYLFSAAIVLLLLLTKRIKMGSYIPFGPALAAGGVITLFFEGQIIAWYLSVFL